MPSASQRSSLEAELAESQLQDCALRHAMPSNGDGTDVMCMPCCEAGVRQKPCLHQLNARVAHTHTWALSYLCCAAVSCIQLSINQFSYVCCGGYCKHREPLAAVYFISPTSSSVHTWALTYLGCAAVCCVQVSLLWKTLKSAVSRSRLQPCTSSAPQPAACSTWWQTLSQSRCTPACMCSSAAA